MDQSVHFLFNFAMAHCVLFIIKNVSNQNCSHMHSCDVFLNECKHFIKYLRMQ